MFALATWALRATPGEGGALAAAECAGDIALDFSGPEFTHGTVLGEQYADIGVHISADAFGGQPDMASVFDSDVDRPETTTDDLVVGEGNLAIIPGGHTGIDGDGDGVADDPDALRDSKAGGIQIYNFEQELTLTSLKFVDKDAGPPGEAVAFDVAGTVVASAIIPNAGDSSVQTISLEAQRVRRLEITYRDSGGVTDIRISCPPEETATPTLARPTPTGALAGPLSSPRPRPIPTVAEVVASPRPEGLPTAGGLPLLGGGLPFDALAIAGSVASAAVILLALRGRRESE